MERLPVSRGNECKTHFFSENPLSIIVPHSNHYGRGSASRRDDGPISAIPGTF